ncbi:MULTISPECIES: MerR family transcriptional regulator [unclassified Idiomarina]|jgi:MerR family mercuric resistance operon transcriptional regulator|uniref:MerR family transcriptional regulator n=1 Tax=unclassified Idiomarina TaxID=2614829 RepID=UPI00257A3BDB|nr:MULTISPECIES: MerR family transcriptional regulator [unclassified Idiomarina]|tara:strand:+ start:6007 stop:6408 length:402 start_codon:yes stop_codon:yes gene_type:complete
MKTFNIGELSEKSGVASHAIRFYERENLMPEPARTQANYRRYPEDAITRLQFIVHAKEWGFTLDEIRELLMLQDANGDRAEVRRIAGKQLAKIRHQIRSLSNIEAVLAETQEKCSGEGSVDGCPIVEAIAHKG